MDYPIDIKEILYGETYSCSYCGCLMSYGGGGGSSDWEPISAKTFLYTDGTVLWRKDMRGGVFYLDKALTALGFNGFEDTDWENVKYK